MRKLTVSIKPDMTYYVNGGQVEKEDLEGLITIRMGDAADKVMYLEVDREVPTGATVELIGMAKANEWKVMLGSTPKRDE